MRTYVYLIIGRSVFFLHFLAVNVDSDALSGIDCKQAKYEFALDMGRHWNYAHLQKETNSGLTASDSSLSLSPHRMRSRLTSIKATTQSSARRRFLGENMTYWVQAGYPHLFRPALWQIRGPSRCAPLCPMCTQRRGLPDRIRR